MSNYIRQSIHLALVGVVLSNTGCKGVILRDPEVYHNEILFVQMALEQDTELLREHLGDGSCTCDAEGVWSSQTCEQTALNILVIENRLAWHVGMMLYNANMVRTRPPTEVPEVPETSTLCPGE